MKKIFIIIISLVLTGIIASAIMFYKVSDMGADGIIKYVAAKKADQLDANVVDVYSYYVDCYNTGDYALAYEMEATLKDLFIDYMIGIFISALIALAIALYKYDLEVYLSALLIILVGMSFIFIYEMDTKCKDVDNEIYIANLCPECHVSGEGCYDDYCANRTYCLECGAITYIHYLCDNKCDRCKEYEKKHEEKYGKNSGNLWQSNHEASPLWDPDHSSIIMTEGIIGYICYDCWIKD